MKTFFLKKSFVYCKLIYCKNGLRGYNNNKNCCNFKQNLITKKYIISCCEIIEKTMRKGSND